MISGTNEDKHLRLKHSKERLLALTGDATKLMQALQVDCPSSWAIYVATIKDEGIVPDDAWGDILRKVRQLFPERQLTDLNDVVVRMNHVVAAQLGRPDRDRI